jgi:hypothetical protein
MYLKATVTTLLCTAFLTPVTAENQHCQEQKASINDRMAQTDNPFTSVDQIRLAELLRSTTEDTNVVEHVRAQVLVNRQAVEKQFTALTQPRMIDESTHYSIRHIVNFTHHHYDSVHQFRVKGTKDGKVWGTDTYTSDSHLGAAAVHAGILEPNQTGIVTIRVVQPLPRFDGQTRYGVHSRSWHHEWDGAFEFVMDIPTESVFVTAGMTRLQNALTHDEPTDPVQVIRQSVLRNRVVAKEQLQTVLAIAAENEKQQEHVAVIDYMTARVHTHGRQYRVWVSLISNGEMRAQVSIATCNGHGYDLHEVNNIHDTPHAVQRQVQYLHHQLISTLPNHSPQLAALSWRVRKDVSDQRADAGQQFEAIVDTLATSQQLVGSASDH